MAERHGISPKDVTDVMEGYADAMLSDLIFNAQRALERELDGGNLADRDTVPLR